MGIDEGRGGRHSRGFVAAVVLALLLLPAAAFAVVGGLTFVEQDKNGVAGVTGLNGAIDVVVSPDGGSAYAVGLQSSAVAAFDRDPATGALTFVEAETDGVGGVDGIQGAFGVTISPDGQNVYVTGHSEGGIGTFTRDPGTSALTFVEFDKDGVAGVDGILGAWGVAVAPGGAHVYVAGDVDDAVATFSRNPTTGALTWVEQDKDGVAGVDGLDTATGVAIPPGGGNVYVTGCADAAVATFSRNPTTGALTWVEQDKNGVGGVTGMACARGVAASADGDNVYVAAEISNAVAAFTRNPDGTLTFAEREIEGENGNDGLQGARDVAVSDDGASVYSAATTDDTVMAFTRDPATGLLTRLEAKRDGTGTIDGIDQTTSVAVSADGTSVYATGETDDALATFAREPAPPAAVRALRSATLNAKKKAKKGKKVKISGDVSAPTDVAGCEAGQQVELQRKVKGKSAFAPLLSLTTDGAGAFSAKVKVKKTADYRAVLAESTACEAATSPAKKVKVKKKKKRKK